MSVASLVMVGLGLGGLRCLRRGEIRYRGYRNPRPLVANDKDRQPRGVHGLQLLPLLRLRPRYYRGTVTDVPRLPHLAVDHRIIPRLYLRRIKMR